MDREKQKRREDLGIRILQNCRNELYSYFPYLDGAFAGLRYCPDEKAGTIGTDGEFLYFSPAYLIRTYGENPRTILRGYLHILLHCLYLHPFYGETIPGGGKGDRGLWNLACDMWVEEIIEREQIPGLSAGRDPVRERCFWILREQKLSAEKLYYMLAGGRFPYSSQELCLAFSFDDHRFWVKEKREKKGAGTRKKWEELRSLTGQKKQQRKKRAGTQKGSGVEEMEARPQGKFDYRKFLKRFAVPREEVELDTESFDYIFYSYGMSLYGNMPLLEPQETREVKKIQDFVIAIDTSMSCSGELVRGFLRETYSVLREQESFFRRMQIHVIQCDERIQSDRLITSQEELKEYMENLELAGKGGTDFRPVFAYIREKQRKGELRGLKGLLYFTDGKGIFPERMPPYDAAFLLMQKEYEEIEVPCWAMKLYLDEEELLERNERTEE